MKKLVPFVSVILAAHLSSMAAGDRTIALEDGLSITVDGDWLAKHNLNGAADSVLKQALWEFDSAVGLTEWQKYVLNTSESTLLRVSNPIGLEISFAKYQPQSISGIFVTRYLKKTADGIVTRTKLATNKDKFAIPKDLSEDHPLAIYEIELAFYNKDGSVTNQATSINKIGVLYAKPSSALSILGVPWCLPGGAPMTVAQLIDVSDLSNGDVLRVYDKTTQRYQVWRLEDGQWVGAHIYSIGDGGVISEFSGDPSQTSLPRGEGVWLERTNVSNAFYRIGEWVDAVVTPKLEAGWNLLGNPETNAWDVAAFARATDQIVIPTAAAPMRYVQNDEGVWGRYVESETISPNGFKIKSVVFREERPLLKIGEGCWLVH